MVTYDEVKLPERRVRKEFDDRNIDISTIAIMDFKYNINENYNQITVNMILSYDNQNKG
jgi:hypothetical protein